MFGLLQQTLIPLFIVSLFAWPTFGNSGFTCTGESPKHICIPENYSRFELPFTEKTNRINVSIDVDEVLRINDADHSFTFSTYFNLEWNERRLNMSSDFGAQFKHHDDEEVIVPVDVDLLQDLWIPNIFIYNLESFKVVSALSELQGLWISTYKNILISKATHITFTCPMRYNKFPFDTQRCLFRVGSYSHDSTKMDFHTNSFGYSSTENTIPLEYDVKIVALKPEDAILDYGSLGNFTLAGMEFVLTRYVTRYIITYYIPSALCVIVSWISFLVPMDMMTGRVVMLVTLLLVLVNIFNNVAANTPRAEVTTALEDWMIVCIIFVFGAILEFAAILLKKQRYVSGQYKVKCKEGFMAEQEKSFNDKTITGQQMEDEYWRINKLSLTFFPILFVIFNIIYWLYCFM